MYPVLFGSSTSELKGHGIGVLTDCISGYVEEERNGIYECQFVYPVTGALYNQLEKGKIISVKPNDTSSNQYYRIYRIINSPLSTRVTVYAHHISYDLNGYPVNPFTASGVTASAALEAILNNSFYSNIGYTVSSTSSTVSNINITKPCSIRNCLGGMDGSFLDDFGGEFEFDNFAIKHYANRGSDKGVRIAYGKNLLSLLDDTSIDGTYTAVYPYAFKTDGTIVTLTEKVIETENLSEYPTNKVLNLDLTDKFSDDSQITESNLRSAANSYITANRINSISQNIKVEFENLWQTEEYKSIALLERVSLCDTVTIDCEPYGISLSAKVVKTTYDFINERYRKIELGKTKSNFVETLNKINNIENELRAQPSIIEAAIAYATKLITGGLGGYVVITPDPTTGYPKEILIMDNPDKTQAVNVWRFNQNGLGHSHSGYNGPFNDVALTYDGQINASRILTGVLNANLIKAGMISDINDNFEINLTTGHITLKDGSVSSTADIWQAGFTIYHSNLNVAASMFNSANDVGVVTAELGMFGERDNEKTYIGLDSTTGDGYVMTDNVICTNISADSGTITTATITTASITTLTANNFGVDEVTVGYGLTIYHSNSTVAASIFKSSTDVGVVTAEDVRVGSRNNEKTYIGVDSSNEGYVKTDIVNTGSISVNNNSLSLIRIRAEINGAMTSLYVLGYT